MRTIPERPLHSYRKNPTSEDEAERIERIAAAFLFAMIAEGKYVDAIRQLPGMDKFEAVDAVVARLIALQTAEYRSHRNSREGLARSPRGTTISVMFR